MDGCSKAFDLLSWSSCASLKVAAIVKNRRLLKKIVQQGRSDCLKCQVAATARSRHEVRCLSMAFNIVSSFRIQAVRATLGALPA